MFRISRYLIYWWSFFIRDQLLFSHCSSPVFIRIQLNKNEHKLKKKLISAVCKPLPPQLQCPSLNNEPFCTDIVQTRHESQHLVGSCTARPLSSLWCQVESILLCILASLLSSSLHRPSLYTADVLSCIFISPLLQLNWKERPPSSSFLAASIQPEKCSLCRSKDFCSSHSTALSKKLGYFSDATWNGNVIRVKFKRSSIISSSIIWSY